MDYEIIRSRLKSVMRYDPYTDENGFYGVASLYFDDLYWKAYHEKIIGIDNRAKYRIRAYNGKQSYISFECKIKHESYIRKETVSITHNEYQRIMDGDDAFLLEIPKQHTQKFYIQKRTALLKPVILIQYDRQAFVYDCGVRVTFDIGTKAATTHDLFDPNPDYYMTENTEQIIMEVKYGKVMPTVIKELFKGIQTMRMPISKYVLCADKMLEVKTHA
jgi:hypothetical protein